MYVIHYIKENGYTAKSAYKGYIVDVNLGDSVISCKEHASMHFFFFVAMWFTIGWW